MKQKLLICAIGLMAVCSAIAENQTVNLAWIASLSAQYFTNVVYVIYTAPLPFQTYTQATVVTGTTATITVPTLSKCYVTAALKDPDTGALSNESVPSNTIVVGNLLPPAKLGKQ